MNQSVVQADQVSFHSRGWRILAGSGAIAALRAIGLDDPSKLSSRALGRPVTDHRSSWVREVEVLNQRIFVKTYAYPTWRDRLRGLGRTTACAPTRARREWNALHWLAGHGFEAPMPWLIAERRVLGFARYAVLATEAWAGQPLDQTLPGADGPTRELALRSLEDFVERLHRAGFRDRNLDLRNLLARRVGDRFVVAKIDSPRHRIMPPSRRPCDRLARTDWERLYQSIVDAGIAHRGDHSEILEPRHESGG